MKNIYTIKHKILLLVLSMSFCIYQPVAAQWINSSSYVDADIKEHKFKTNFDLSLGYGYASFGQFVYSSYFNLNRYYTYNLNNISYYNFANYGTAALTGRFLVARGLRVGFDVTYERINADVFQTQGASGNDPGYNVKIGSQSANVIAIMPRVDAFWYRSINFRLYSTLSAGIAIVSSQTTVPDQNGNVLPKENFVNFAGQISPIGLEAGRKLSFIAELGWGYRGIINAGVRYRF
ncbi:MAG: hypothetical protein QM528_07860 [Phycisphaerales bacterium]|nr:hypothetical protein [Phycisphaerales bacterium]